MRATWNGATLAESDDTLVVEGNHYFPAESIRSEYFLDSDTNTTCRWEGEASYKTIRVDGQENPGAAWYYPDPEPADYAGHPREGFAGRSAFWRGVTVEP